MTTQTISKQGISSEKPQVRKPYETTRKTLGFVGHDLPGLTADQLLERAVLNARGRYSRRGAKHPRWTAVKDAFALGAGYSRTLCLRYGIDRDEMVKR